MNIVKTRIRFALLFWIPVILMGTLTACQDAHKTNQQHETAMEEQTKSDQTSLPSFGNLIEVKTTHMDFILPDEIPSGWTTFRYTNESEIAHFMLIDKMPVYRGEQLTHEDFKEVPPVFTDAMNLINAGKAEEGFAEFSRLPEWFPEVIFSGGVGIISPGETAQTTVYMEPGIYVIECYIKTGGVFHPMHRQLNVKENTSNENPPKPTMKLTISKEEGIQMLNEPQPGIQTIAVHFKDQEPHEHFLGHDVHLVKLENDGQLKELESWMDWSDPKGLETPAPVRFLGGAQEMPAGNTAYITIDLKPGNYALISEVPNASSKNMLKKFTVSELKQ